MPNIGPFELIVILVIALIVIGPGRLPEVGNALGKSIREFRKASSDVTEAARVDASPTPAPEQPAPAASANPALGMSPTAAPAPTPEPLSVTPTAPTVPAPVPMPQAPGDDETDPTP